MGNDKGLFLNIGVWTRGRCAGNKQQQKYEVSHRWFHFTPCGPNDKLVVVNTPNPSVWNDHQWSSLPSLEHDHSTEVCVVGLGGSGLSCLQELTRLGVSTIGIEARQVAAGAAGCNGGFWLAGNAKFYHQTVQQHGRAWAAAFYEATLSQMQQMLHETPQAIRPVGSLRIAMSPQEWLDCQQQQQAMNQDGFAAEPYEGNEGRGLLFPQDGAFNPLQRCRTMALGLQSQGVPLYENTPALAVTGGLVQTPNATIKAKAVVVAVDGGLERLLPQLRGVVRTARLQMLATAPTWEVQLPRPVYARYGYEYWQQLPSGQLALGGYRDAGGEGEWTFDGQPSRLVQQHLEGFLRQHLQVKAPITHRWAATVGYTDNGVPVLQEIEPGLWAIGAYSGTGNVVGAMYGRAVAQRIATGQSFLDPLL